MKILVPIKRVSDPDNANKMKVAPDGTLSSEGMEWKLNPYDEYAVETALRLNENASNNEKLGETIVVSIGPEDAQQTMRQALAMGADRGILIAGKDEELDAAVVARALKAIVEKESPDLVVLGKLTVDSESNLVGQMLAEWLGWPMSTHTQSITTSDGGKNLILNREVDTGELTVKIEGPAVITVADRILMPQAVKNGVTPADHAYPASDGGRYASLKGIMAARKKTIDQMDLASLNIDATPLTTYTQFSLPPARSGSTTFVENVQELVQKLQHEAKAL